MSDHKRRRDELRERLANFLGGDLADDLMGELPPEGWESVARRDDLDEVKFDIIALRSDLEDVKSDVAVLKSDVAVLKSDVATLKIDMDWVKRDLARINNSIRFMAGSLITVSVAVIAILVQINLSIASLR